MATEWKVKAGTSIGSEKKEQLRFNNEGKADKQIPVLAMPSQVIADAFAAAVQVGKGNLCRIHGSGTEYVAFSEDSAMAAPGAATQTALLLDGTTLVVATGEYVRTSAAIRIEVIED